MNNTIRRLAIAGTAIWLAASAAGAANPAASADTKPFPVDPARWAEAKALVGTSCTKMFDDRAKVFPDYATPKGFANIVVTPGFVTPLEKGGARFAFLIIYKDEVSKSCTIADVVALPDAKHANAFLQCDTQGPDSYGFGMRLAGHSAVVGYWTLDAATGKLVRRSAAGAKILCHEPESGD